MRTPVSGRGPRRGKPASPLRHPALLGLMVTVAQACLFLPAQAQDAGGAAAPAKAAARDEGVQLEDVVVTARKREELLSSVPVAVTALSADALEKVNIQDGGGLFGVVPNLYFTGTTQLSSELRFTMRGVGARSPLEPSVGSFIDGVYVPTVGWNMDFLEIDRVEILRGPQGALFGRNTQAGAISIQTRRPSFEFGGNARLDYSDFNTFRGSAYMTGPVSETLAFSAAGLIEHTDGYLDNATVGGNPLERRKSGGRAALLWNASEQAQVLVSADAIFEAGGFYGYGEPLETQPNRAGKWVTVMDQQNYEDLDNWGASINATYDFAAATLTSITGYRKVRSLSISDADSINTPNRDGAPPGPIPEVIRGRSGFPPVTGNYFVIGRKQSLLSQEFRLASSGDGRLQWLAGLYGFVEDNNRLREQRTTDSFLFSNAGNFVSDAVEQRRKGFAVFGQAKYAISDRLNLTAGGRFSKETDRQDLRIAFNIGAGRLAGAYTQNPKDSYSDFSPMASLSYRIGEASLVYATVSRGFKGGGFNLQAPAMANANLGFDSETSTNYEVGTKLRLLDNRLSFNAALYQIDTRDAQVTTTVVFAGSIVTSATANAARTRTKGVEVEVAAIPVRGLTLSAAAGYTDAKYRTYVVNPTLTLSGRRIEEIPDWTASANIEYQAPLSDDLELVAGASWRYVGEILQGTGLPESPHVTVDSYDSVGAHIGLASGKWELTAYVENVFDSYNVVFRGFTKNFVTTPGQDGQLRAEAPRRFGIKGKYRF